MKINKIKVTWEASHDWRFSSECICKPSPEKSSEYSTKWIARNNISVVSSNFCLVKLNIILIFNSYLRKPLLDSKWQIWNNNLQTEGVHERSYGNGGHCHLWKYSCRLGYRRVLSHRFLCLCCTYTNGNFVFLAGFSRASPIVILLLLLLLYKSVI